MRLKQRVEILERELEELTAKVIALQKYPSLKWYAYPDSDPFAHWRITPAIEHSMSGNDVRNMFRELYDHLGVEHVTTPR